jgi:hypothetical protein
MTYPGELAKVTGLSRPEAGIGNLALVREKITISPSTGSYIKLNLAQALDRGIDPNRE